MITPEECFAIWAPDQAVWAPWAKPTVFAQSGGFMTERPLVVPALDHVGIPEAWSSGAVVVDLPGAEAVAVGLALAERGFRPVPLFNGTSGPSAVIDLTPLTDALGAGAALLRPMVIKPDARPAFLLDARRGDTLGAATPGHYDNRWVVLPQDLPSAAFLGSQGIREITLVLRLGLPPAVDLAHVLLRWQQAGLRIRAIDLDTGHLDENLTVPVPSWFRRAWYSAIILMGLRRNNVGGFGSMVPEQTSGRGGFYG